MADFLELCFDPLEAESQEETPVEEVDIKVEKLEDDDDDSSGSTPPLKRKRLELNDDEEEEEEEPNRKRKLRPKPAGVNVINIRTTVVQWIPL